MNMMDSPSSLYTDSMETKADVPHSVPPMMYRFGKRFFDLLLATFALIFLSPVLVIVSALIKICSPGPVLYKGARSGLHGKPFHILKFRSMVVDADRIGGTSTAFNDPRLISIGKLLRKYKLDELPQLINVLKGDMSIVGPRPQVEKYTKLYNEEEKIILSVKPGLTDYASIRFINLDQILGDNSVDEKYMKEIEPEKNKLRIQYAREHSFSVDMKIVFTTLLQLIKIKTIWNTEN